MLPGPGSITSSMKTFHLLLCTFSYYLTCGSCVAFDVTVQARSTKEQYCASWRFNVEAHNLQDWKVVPSDCEEYVSKYMLGGQYRSDTEMVCNEAKLYAETINVQSDGKDAWIFDIDDTALSNLGYYAANRFGAVPFNRQTWVEWETQTISPAIESTLSLYNQLIDAQWTVFFLTGRHEIRRNVTIDNLLRSKYNDWSGLILRQDADREIPAKSFKSAKRDELQKQGFRIWGNVGDQWSDLIGLAAGERTFKIPNPMYYIA